jgi:hypothetical protein
MTRPKGRIKRAPSAPSRRPRSKPERLTTRTFGHTVGGLVYRHMLDRLRAPVVSWGGDGIKVALFDRPADALLTDGGPGHSIPGNASADTSAQEDGSKPGVLIAAGKAQPGPANAQRQGLRE